MPVRLCILSLGLLMLQPVAMARTALEPRVGMEALLLNCVLYDPACMKAPVRGVQPALETAKDAVADAKSAVPSLSAQRDGVEDPETTGSIRQR